MNASRSMREQSVPRFALRRDEAATSIGVSPSKFDMWVDDGRMPKGHKIDGVVLWDVDELREHWLAMKEGTTMSNPLDRMVV